MKIVKCNCCRKDAGMIHETQKTCLMCALICDIRECGLNPEDSKERYERFKK